MLSCSSSRLEPMITNRLEMNHTFRPSHSLYGTSRLDRASRPRQIAPPPPPAPTCVGVGVGVGGGAPVPARADGCPVGAPRAVMDIKHPGNPKSVCRCIPIAILRQRGSLGFKFAGINQVYTRCIPGICFEDSEKLYLVYTRYILFT
jgi:hypothetical protein